MNLPVLKVAIQKSGRLHEDSMQLFQDAGFKWKKGKALLKWSATNFPIEFLFVRDDDIPSYVQSGTAHIGIVGKNVILEEEKDVEILEDLDFGQCRLSLAVPKNSSYEKIEDLGGKVLATSYPVILSKYLKEKGVEAQIKKINGSVELAPSIELSDAICDLVSSGSTLLSNGLREMEVILNCHSQLISHKSLNSEVYFLLGKVLERIKSVIRVKDSKYVMLNAPNESIGKIQDILPGVRSATIIPLSTPGWSAMHSVVKENKFWENIDTLKSLGAEGILVLPIEKMLL